MRRLTSASILAIVLTLSTSVPVLGTVDNKGPRCADISGGFASYTSVTVGASTDAVVKGGIHTTDPSCVEYTYTLHVLNGSGTAQIASQTVAGTGLGTGCPPVPPGFTANCLTFSIDLGPASSATTATSSPPNAVCVFFTSQTGDHLADRAPNSGCVGLLLNGTGVPEETAFN